MSPPSRPPTRRPRAPVPVAVGAPHAAVDAGAFVVRPPSAPPGPAPGTAAHAFVTSPAPPVMVLTADARTLDGYTTRTVQMRGRLSAMIADVRASFPVPEEPRCERAYAALVARSEADIAAVALDALMRLYAFAAASGSPSLWVPASSIACHRHGNTFEARSDPSGLDWYVDAAALMVATRLSFVSMVTRGGNAPMVAFCPLVGLSGKAPMNGGRPVRAGGVRLEWVASPPAKPAFAEIDRSGRVLPPMSPEDEARQRARRNPDAPQGSRNWRPPEYGSWLKET